MATLKDIRAERRLVKYAMKGDKRSLEMLITKYIDFCYSVAIIFLHDDKLAKIAVESTLEKVYSEMDSLYDAKGFKVWLYDILKAEITKVEPKGTLLNTGHKLDKEFNSKVINYFTLNKIQPEEMEESENLLSLIRNLPKDEKELIVLIDYEGMTISDTAILTDTPINEVRQKLYRTKKALVKGLAQSKLNKISIDNKKEEIYGIDQHGM
ncbi:MAG: sigma-70 family RNA polymerase sigma factor [Candidatus Sericytochromatia bacterium]